MSVVASGVRISWPDLPGTVRAWVERLIGGGPVVAHASQSGGFSPGTADRVRTAGGRSAFVKAVSPDQNETTPELHRREAAVVRQLPPSARIPTLLDSYDDGRWVALVYAEIDGRTPQVPWVDADIDAAITALHELAADLTPAPPGLPDLSAELRSSFLGWARVRDDPPPGLDPWAADRLDELVRWSAAGVADLTGDTVVHVDVRADNLLVGLAGYVSLVDWPWASRGASWVDRLLLIVNVDLYGGHDPERLVERHLGGLASPPQLTAVLAGFCGYFTDVARRPAVPGLPTVRAFQQAQADSTLIWLRRRLDDGREARSR